MKKIALLLILAAASGCSNNYSIANAQAKSQSQAAQNASETKTYIPGQDYYYVDVYQEDLDLVWGALSNKLKDPYSAQITDVVKISEGGGSSYYCGQVNSKNSYGAFTGKTKFIYSPSQDFFALENDIKVRGVIGKLCNF